MATQSQFETYDVAHPGKRESYKRLFKFHFIFNKIKDEGKKRARFLSCCSRKTFDLTQARVPTKLKDTFLTDILESLQQHFAPLLSEVARRHAFYKRDQALGETIANYVAAVQQAARDWNFMELDNMLRDPLICGLHDEQMQRCRFTKKNVTFMVALGEALASELAEWLTKKIWRPPVKPVYTHQESDSNLDDDSNPVEKINNPAFDLLSWRDTQPGKLCDSCGDTHSRSTCWFRGTRCQNCGCTSHI